MKMETVYSSETSVHFHQITLHSIPEYRTLLLKLLTPNLAVFLLHNYFGYCDWSLSWFYKVPTINYSGWYLTRTLHMPIIGNCEIYKNSWNWYYVTAAVISSEEIFWGKFSLHLKFSTTFYTYHLPLEREQRSGSIALQQLQVALVGLCNSRYLPHIIRFVIHQSPNNSMRYNLSYRTHTINLWLSSARVELVSPFRPQTSSHLLLDFPGSRFLISW
jgi:hypothetical protein